ncbi:MAG: nucleotidyltransferase domain-containing protein [Clostridia bacterium]|nr:nucleotidyltransferase domain-containing protein [Clostridia bacterium]
MYSGIIKTAVEHGALKIILFGSRAKGTDTEHSDIDICIIAKTTNKRRLAATISAEIDCDIPVDVLVYTPDEWEDCISDETSFATKILKEGTVLYG